MTCVDSETKEFSSRRSKTNLHLPFFRIRKNGWVINGVVVGVRAFCVMSSWIFLRAIAS